MVPIEMRMKAERRIRRLLYEEQMGQPDVVQYGDACIQVYWQGARHSIIVEITDKGELGQSRLGDPLEVVEPYARLAYDPLPPGVFSRN